MQLPPAEEGPGRTKTLSCFSAQLLSLLPLSGALLLLSLALWNKIRLLLPRHLSFTVTHRQLLARHLTQKSHFQEILIFFFFFTKFLPGCWGKPTSCLHFPTSGACDLGEAWVAPISSSSVAVSSNRAFPSPQNKKQGGSNTLYLVVASFPRAGAQSPGCLPPLDTVTTPAVMPVPLANSH